LAVDHLGFGLSEKPTTAPYLPRDHTDRLHAFIQTLDLRDVTLVVHDFGGPIATPLVARDPSRFRQVIAVNTWVWPTSDDVQGDKLSKFVRSPLGRFLYLWCNASPRWLVPASFADKRRLSKAVHRHHLAPFSTRHERHAPWTLGCNLTNPEAYAPELPQVITALGAVPVSAIWGTKDGILGAEPFIRWKHEFPNSRVIELDESGHFPQEESPAAFLSALDSILVTS
jgi:haloalkane dehalogenase